MADKNIKILFAASEAEPLIKVGGLGDVLGSLPKALYGRGYETAVILPLYEPLLKERGRFKLLGRKIFIRGKRAKESVSLYETKLPRSAVKVFLVENKRYLSGGGVYFSKTAIASHREEIERFRFFSEAVYQLIRNGILPFKPQLVHANDWHTGHLVRLLGEESLGVGTVFTVHNLANQGARGKENYMAEGIKFSDVVTTVSRTYAREILTPEYGFGLDRILRRRKKIIGILNGIDFDSLPKVPASKDAEKLKLQKLLHLDPGLSRPLFAFVARLTDQKGVRFLLSLVPRLVVNFEAQFIFLGTGEEALEAALMGLAKSFPGQVAVRIGFDEPLAGKIYAGSDFFLMPSLYEPCGLGQMIAMHYGTIPIARKTGGLADSIKDGETGFLFEGKNDIALFEAAARALDVFGDFAGLKRMQARAKQESFSWKLQAAEYRKVYRAALYAQKRRAA